MTNDQPEEPMSDSTTESTREEDAMPEPDPETVQRDLNLVIGGGLNVDEIGPDAYDAVISRLRAHPEAYLAAVERDHLGASFDALTESGSHLIALFEVLSGVPEAHRIAASMLRHFDAALLIYDRAESREALSSVLPEETVNQLARLDDRRRTLRALIERAEG
jgi:hypothetical protein